MKITIDTAHDSKEEIREAIRMLNSLIDSTHMSMSSSEPTTSTEPSGLIGETNPDMFSMFGENKEEEPKEQSLRIIEY